MTAGTFDKMESWPTFELIHLKKDNINNVGQLICYPLSHSYLFGRDSHGVFNPGIQSKLFSHGNKINAMQTSGFQIANPSSADEESMTDGHDSYASNSGVDSEKEKTSKPVIVAFGEDKQWRLSKLSMNKDHLVHQRRLAKNAYRDKLESTLNISAIA